MKYDFLVETYETERVKVVSAWSMFQDGDLPVRPNEEPDRAYLAVYEHRHPDYEIAGWCWGREAKKEPLHPGTPGRPPLHYVKRGNPILKEPGLLKDILRSRQERKYGKDWYHRIWIENIRENRGEQK